MGPIPIVLIVAGYSVAACVMAVFWSYIPPRHAGYDIALGLLWPALLVVMISYAFVNAGVRAIDDQDGRFAGLIKDSKWRERYVSKESQKAPQ